MSSNDLKTIQKKLVGDNPEQLGGMSKLASERISAGRYWFEIGSKKRYVRINSSKFRAVSLDAENPCGHLLRKKKEVGGKILKSALLDASDLNCENHCPGNSKPEHRVQASIIWQALTDPYGLPKTLTLEKNVEALWFVTDELSLPPIRADIIMLGEREGYFFPVFIELKHKRDTKVVRQLRDAMKIACEVGTEFCQFLSSATGKPAKNIRMEHSMPVVIWGDFVERQSKEALEICSNLLTICHREQGDKDTEGYGVFKFSSSTSTK